MPPPPPSKLRIDNVRLSSSSRKRRSNHSIVSPRTFLTGIVFAASGLLSLSIYLTTRLDGQSPPTSQTASSSSYVKGDATAAISDGENDDVRPVICNELLKDTTIWDPNERAEKDEMKRFTATDPPFWIALHNPSFDKMRWVSIKKSGEYYEKGVTSIFHEILSTYDLTKEQPIAPLVIDIGMNIGWFSLYSRAHGHDVAAFEPNPVMFLRMCESLGYNKWGGSDDSGNSVSLWKYGLGVQKGSFNLTVGNNPGGSSFFGDRLAKKFRKTIPVEVTTLDTVAVKQGWLDRKVSLMKVDVEGFEPYVFEGGKRLLREGHVENIFMENSVTDIERVGEMVDLLYSAGFRMKGIFTVNGDPYHEDWWHTFNPEFEKRHSGVIEPSDQMKFLAKVTCNIWWINSKYTKAQ